MGQTYMVATPQPYVPAKPLRSEVYRKFVRSHPCEVCGSERWVEAAHMGPHGLNEKSSDDSCIPLCQKHHLTNRDSYHNLGPVEFARAHNIDVQEITNRLWAEFVGN